MYRLAVESKLPQCSKQAMLTYNYIGEMNILFLSTLLKKGKFTICSFYKSQYGKCKSISVKRLPNKKKGNLLCMDCLLGEHSYTRKPKEMPITDMDWYYMCKKKGKSIGHLLIHCEIAMTLWNEFIARVGLA